MVSFSKSIYHRWRNIYLQLALQLQLIPLPASVEQCVEWLKNNRGPWDLVLQHWKVIFNLRSEDLKISSATEIFDAYEKWPILKHPKAYTIIEEDFVNFMFNEEPIQYEAIQEWSDFYDAIGKLCPLDKKKEKDHRVKHLLNLLKTAESGGNINFLFQITYNIIKYTHDLLNCLCFYVFRWKNYNTIMPLIVFSCTQRKNTSIKETWLEVQYAGVWEKYCPAFAGS